MLGGPSGSTRSKTSISLLVDIMKKLIGDDPSMMGAEPSWVGQETFVNPNLALIKALNWYSYSFNNKSAKEFVLDYAKSVGRQKNEIAAIRSLPESKFNKQFGWIARMMCVGYKPDDKVKDFFTKKYKELILLAKEDSKKTVASPTAALAPVISIQQRIVDKSYEEIGEIECFVDDFILSGFKLEIEIEKYIDSRKLSSVVLKKVCEFFVRSASEIGDAITTSDPYIKESYSNYKKTDLRKLKAFLDRIVSASNKGAENNKPVRKKRKTREKPAAVLVSKVAFLAEDPETGMKSINPEKMIGASSLWVYNIKTRMLGVYYAENAKGLSIKGTTLQNFQTETSLGKKLRKPKETLDALLAAGKIKLKQLLPSLTTKDLPLTGRLNSDTLLVRVTN